MLLLTSCTASNAGSGAGGLSLGAKALKNLTPFEKRVLKDKKVTVAELVESTQIYVECLDALHFDHEVNDPSVLGPSGIEYGYEIPKGVQDQDAYSNKMELRADSCRNSVEAVEDVWVLQNQASQSDIDKAKREFVPCVRRAGVTLAPDATFEQAGLAAKKQMTDNASQEIDPQSSAGKAMLALESCMDSIGKESVVALPGLEQALKSLNTSSW